MLFRSGSNQTLTVVPPGASDALSRYGANALVGTYGSLIVFSNGSYAYHLDNSNAAVQALASGETLSEAFNYTVSDGYTSDKAVLTLTITGTNNTPLISATDLPAGDVAALTETNSTLTTNGSLTVTDVDLTDTVKIGRAHV